MTELVIIQQKEVVTTSLKIAEVFEKRHDLVLRDIDNLLLELSTLDISERTLLKFEESSCFNAKN
jgi:Rha family phage regulatory protein